MLLAGGLFAGAWRRGSEMRDAGRWLVSIAGVFFKVSFEPGFVKGSKPAHEEKKDDGEDKAKGKTRSSLSSLRSELRACV